MFGLVRIAASRARGMMAAAIVFGFLSGVGNGTLIAVAQRSLDVATPARIAAVAFVVLCIGVLITRFLSLAVMARLPPRALHELRLHLSEQVMATSLVQLEQIGVGGLQSLLTQDVGAVVGGLIGLPPLLIAVAALLGSLGYTATLSWTLFAWVSGLLVGTFLLRTALDRRVSHAFMSAMDQQAALIGAINDQVVGAKELQMSAALRDGFRRTLATRSSQFTESQASAMTRLNFSNIAVEAGFQLLLGFVVFLAPIVLSDAPMSSRVGGAMVCLFLYGQLQIVNLMVPGLRQAAAALQRIESLQLALPTPSHVEAAVIPAPRQIELCDVTRSYGADAALDAFRLGPISLTFRRGELGFIVGGNGSGKSTLAKVLCGLYAPDGGRLLVDETEIDDSNRAAYRELFAGVFSDFHLFDVLPSGLDLAPAPSLLGELLLSDKVQIENGSFSTTLLSQGQRKRLALLISYLQDRPIYLFDEWAADQDPAFRETFYTRLLPQLKDKGKIVIVITHDDRYFGLADRIIKLDCGRVVDERLTGVATALPPSSMVTV